MPKLKPIVLDGRVLEGGGQLLRNALCLAALTRQSITITNIRGNRSGGGGLKAQHLACVQWLAHASEAKVSGAHRGGTELDFHPKSSPTELSPAFTKKKLASGEEVYEASMEIGTAGSITLALQAVLPFVLFSAKPRALPVHLTLTGGTNVSASPSFEYLSQVLFPTLHAMGLPLITARLKRRGMNSIGCAELVVPPVTAFPMPGFIFRPLQETRERAMAAPERIEATFVGPNDLHEMVKSILPELISQHFPRFTQNPSRESSTLTSSSPSDPHPSSLIIQHHLDAKGFYFLLTATSTPSPTQPTSSSAHPILTSPSSHSYILAKDLLTSSRLFDPTRKTSHANLTKALDSVARGLAKEWSSGAWVDEHLRDQIVIYRALAEGMSEVCVGVEADGSLREATLHTLTAEWVVKTMLGVKFDDQGNCQGCAFVPS